MRDGIRLKVAVVGTGISGLSAAWLLSQRHDVTVYEQAERIGGHSNTVIARVGEHKIPVDTGFIVFNRQAYPNLTAMFRHLGVPTQTSDMSLAVSLRDGDLEYSGTGLRGLFAQPGNLFRPRFWSMLRDLVKFYRQATRDADLLKDETVSLGDYLSGRWLWRRVPRRSSVADGQRDLVGAAERDPVIPGCDLHSLPSQSRLAAACAASRLGNRGRRQHRLCPAADSALCRPDQARHRRRHGAAHRGRCHRDGLARRIRTATTMSSWPRMPIRPCRHSPIRLRTRPNCSARSATAATSPYCTRTRASCPGVVRPGRAGTISAHAMGPPTVSASPTG